MYHEHFGLERAPFRITPDTELFYPGGGRGEVLEALVYAVTSGEGIVKVTGEVGTGKTMICRMLEVRLPRSVEVVYIANPSLSPEDILHAIALEMNLPVEASAGRLQVMHALQQRLLEMHAQNRRVVVFVEEAQGMPTATLEEIRLLSNLETQRDKLLQIVLFGQPELDEALGRSHIRQLRERITHSFRLEPLSRTEVREYVRFRMRAVGYRGPDVFKDGAYRQLARASEGLVRRINILADKALLAAFAEDTHNVAGRHMRVAIEDGSFGRRSGSRVWWLGGVAALLLAAVGTLFALEHLPWQQWLRHYGFGAASLLSAPPLSTPTPRPVSNQTPTAEPSGTTTPASTAQTGAAISTPTGATTQPEPVLDAVVREPVAAAADVATIVARPAASIAEPAPAAASMGGAVEGVGKPTTQAVSESVVAAAQPVVATVSSSTETVVAAAEAANPAPAPVSAPVVASTSTSSEGVAVSAPKQTGQAGAQTTPTGSTASTAPAPPKAVDTTSASAGADRPTPYMAPSLGSVDSGNRLLAERAVATASWLQTARGSNFCIQLLLADVGRQGSLESFLARMQQLGAYEQIFIYEAVIGGRSWFGVLYGEFESYDGARSALEALPEDLKRHKPFIRNVRDIVG